MKGRFFIIIFLFLIIVFPVAASTTETFSRSGAMSFDTTPPASGANGNQLVHGYAWLIFQDIENFQGLSYVYIIVPQAQWKGTKVAESTSTSLAINSVTVGTGTYQYNQIGNGDYRLVLIVNDDWDVSAYSGLVSVEIVDDANIEAGWSTQAELYYDYHNIQPANTVTFSSMYHDSVNPDKTLDVTHTAYTEYDFVNDYTYYKEGIIPYISVEKYTSPSDWTVETENGVEIHGDTSTNMVDFIASGTPENNTFYVSVTDNYGNSYSDTISFLSLSAGYIDLNQSFYTEPEDIQINVGLTTYNFDFHSYYIITEVSEDLDTWDNVAGTYNGTTKITNTTDSRILDVDTWLYDLPIWIRSRLVEYDKRTGEYATLDTTPAVLFNPPIPDSIKFGGTVIDADTNQIISGATVSVDGVTTASDTTNTWGEFLIYLYPGIYTVTASKTGYQTYTSEDLLMEYDNTWAQIYLTPIGYGNGTLYGNVNDANTGYAISDVHVIITNTTDEIDAYTSSGGYYEATGLAQSSTYTIRAVKSGYYTYNGSVTTEASGASHKSFEMVSETATPTPTATVLPTSTYPGGEGHEWTNDEIVTMLRVLVPGFFLLMLVFLLLAVMLGINGNNGNGGQRGLGLDDIWRRQ